MKKLLSLILAMVLLLSLASCGDRGNESSSYEDSQYFYIGKDSSKPIDRYNKPALIKDVKEYVAPVYSEAFDPNRQTLTKDEYDRLYKAIIADNTEFKGTLYFRGTTENIDLADRSKSDVMINYMSSQYGNKVFSEEELKSILGEKFVVTEYDLYMLKLSNYVDWQPKENTYAFYALDKVSQDSYRTGNDRFVGYRDMGDSRYEFYFSDVNWVNLRDVVRGMDWTLSGEALEEEMQELYKTEANGIIKYQGRNYYCVETPWGVQYFSVQQNINSGAVVTLEYKENKIKLVDISGVALSNGPEKFPETYSKIPTE